ncbi:hypothetical protein R6Q57_003380 [Mikania cordata]
MGNGLWCCLSCLLPCGALDLIRIVHLDGFVEELTRRVTAGEVLINYPNYVLSKPSSQGVRTRVVILSSHTELKRGGIYFLIPVSSVSEKKRKIRRDDSGKMMTVMGDDLKLSSGVVTEKRVRRHRARRSVDGGDWKPRLDSIYEEE